jgi:hypothetical protein
MGWRYRSSPDIAIVAVFVAWLEMPAMTAIAPITASRTTSQRRFFLFIEERMAFALSS